MQVSIRTRNFQKFLIFVFRVFRIYIKKLKTLFNQRLKND